MLMIAIANEKTAGCVDKTKLDKPGVNQTLSGDNVNELDNINFFPREEAQQSRALGKSEDELPTRKLPQATDPGSEPTDGTRYNDLEGRYVDTHHEDVLAGLKAYIA